MFLEKAYLLIGFFLVVLHALFFVYLLFTESLWKRGVAGLVIILLYSLYGLFFRKASGEKFYYSGGIFLMFGILFSSLTLWVLAIEFPLSILYPLVIQKRWINFNPFIVTYRASRYKRYKWNDFSNVILKDNILTLDFKNNKLIQREINNPVDEKEFNAFAREHLEHK